MVAITAIAAGLFLLLLLPSLSTQYGFYSDELYYLACAKRLAFGYVDHPPFFVFVLWLHQMLFGDSLVALRALPAAAGALTALLAGSMARRMGGGLLAQVMATLAVATSPATLAIFSFFTVNCLAILLWTLASWVFLELCLTREPRLWIVLGAVLGVAFLTKHTAVVPIAGIAAGALLTPLRRDFLTRWPWLATFVFALIVSPNLYWQVANDWPSLAFYAGLGDTRYSATALEQIVGQITFQNPASFPIWAGGLFFFMASPRAHRLQPLGWLFVTAFALAILGQSLLPYRLAGVFPVAFAGGAVLLESIRKVDASRLRRFADTYALPSLMLTIGLAASTMILPILPPEILARHPLYDAGKGGGFRPEIGTNEIPYNLGNRTHWKSFVSKVAEVHRSLTPEQQDSLIILADYFGHAGALEYYGGEYSLPPVFSPMTGYLLWGPPDNSPDTVIAIGIDEAFLQANFNRVTVAATFRCTYCPPVVSDLPIRVASGPKRPFAELWPQIGQLEDRRRRMLRAQRSR